MITARRMDQPFPCPRPYVSDLQSGSPLSVDVIVPTLIISGAVAGLGLLRPLELVEQAA